ncbi:NUDIX hydrolase [Evansella cellulosilytica]|uniref:NUDIX hydrolase n=1 Tax=Evansella cellulosilytica (strain ATCC 21833 / DSM 2522 / FERM P-1141 / JCM 9156 / N-4) TaxID=649639 RepID=E6TQB3_EVAC2|nr:NUDIX domain-containing protein [Evansella cellulosilytica]ADU29291.1 NUDIX hydrolase [Evansella cellulosilytica DSM 2522]
MEIWDVYDKNRNITGKTMKRGEPFEKEAYHLVVHVCLFNENDEMLIQQRHPFKKGWPNMWDISVGGSAVAGDTSQQAAEREVLEELGYKINLRNVRPSLTINFEFGFDDYFLVDVNLPISELTLQPEEVQRVKWATKEEIMSMIEEGIFIPYHNSLIELLFDMRKHMGGHRRK